MAGQPFVMGQVPAGTGVVVGGADAYQVTPKSFHPDGSVAFAVVAGIATVAANAPKVLTLSTGTASTGTARTTAMLKATGIAVSLTTGARGSAVFAANSADWDNPQAMVPGQPAWVSGHVMSMWRYRKQVGTDAHLVLWLEVALYSNGDVEVFPWIENGYLQVAGPTNRSDTYTLTIGGVQRFSQAIDLPHHCRTPLIGSSSPAGGAELSYWLGTQRRVRVKQQRSYLDKTQAVPAFMADVSFPTWTGDTTATYQPLQQGQYRSFMSAGGSSGAIGLVCRWHAAYLTSDDPVAYESMLRQDYSHGRYGIHYRDETTQRPIVVTDYPTLQVTADPAASPYHLDPLASTGQGAFTYTPVPSGTNPPFYEQAHHPAPPYVSYIATGRPFFLEACQFAATCHYLQLGYGRYGTDGILLNWLMQRRQHAWTTRTLAMAVAASPNDDPVRAGLAATLDKNIEFYNVRRNNPFGILPQPGSTLRSNGDTRDMDRNQPFMADFYVSALGFAVGLRLGSDASHRTMLRENFEFSAKSTVMRFGGTGADEWPVCDAAGSPQGWVYSNGTQGDPNDIASVFGSTPDDSFDIHLGTGNFFANAGDCYAYWQRQMVIERRAQDQLNGASILPVDPGPRANPGVTLPLRGGFFPSATALWGNAMLALPYTVQHGAAGAAAAWQRLTSASNFGDLIANAVANKTPEYMLAPAPVVTAGAVVAPAVGTRENITRVSASTIDPDGGSANGSGAWFNSYYNAGLLASASGSWCGGCWAPEYGDHGAVILYGGGHGASLASVAFVFDIGTGAWSCVGYPQSVPPNGNWTGLPVFSSNNDASYVSANDLRDRTNLDYAYTTGAGTSYVTLGAHMYFNTQYDPTVGAKGSLIIGVNQALNDPNTPPPDASLTEPYIWHRLDLATGLISRGKTGTKSLAGSKNDNAMVRDTKRGRWLRIRQQNSTVEYQDASDAHPRPVKTMTATWEGGNPVGTFGVRNHSPIYVEELDATFIFSGNQAFNGQVNAQVIDHRTGALVGAAVTIPPRNFPYGGQSVGVAYVPRLNAFYFYEGRRSTTCEVLQLSTTDPRTSTYTWRRESFTGPTPPGTDPTSLSEAALTEELHGAWRKWVFSQTLDCLIWAPGLTPSDTCQDGQVHDGIVQAWRPPGAIIG